MRLADLDYSPSHCTVVTMKPQALRGPPARVSPHQNKFAEATIAVTCPIYFDFGLQRPVVASAQPEVYSFILYLLNFRGFSIAFDKDTGPVRWNFCAKSEGANQFCAAPA